MKTYEAFNDYLINFIKSELPEHEGRSVYACDLGNEITNGINCDGTATYSTYEAKQYIREWCDEAGEYWEYENWNFGEHLHNPFDEPEAFMVCMIIEGVSSILAQCEIIDSAWNDKIELTEETIAAILSQIDGKEYSF